MPTSSLVEALQLRTARVIAFVGAGGKTTALWRISNELIALGRHVIIAPTAHILEPKLPLDSIEYLTENPEPDQVNQLLDRAPRLIVAAGQAEIVDFDIANEYPPARAVKLRGLDPLTIDELCVRLTGLKALAGDSGSVPAKASSPHSETVWLIEADGARRHLLKAPAEHEPAIPACAEVVVIVAALDAIDQPLNETNVHRWEKFAELSAAHREEPISVELLARVLLHEKGGLKNIPPSARVCVLLTQRASSKLHPSANSLTNQLLQSNQIDHVVVASLRAKQPVLLVRPSNFQSPTSNFQQIATIILAAGESKRFGEQAKQLLDWRGRSFVQIAVDNALEAGCKPVIVVLGSHAAEIRSNLQHRPVIMIENPDWPHGQSTSVRMGLQALPKNIKAALFMPIDQPNLTSTILNAIAASYRATGKPIVVAAVNGKRTTPVLFDRSLFNDILSVEGDRGPRELIDQNPERVSKVEIDPEAAVDVDTLDSYNRLFRLTEIA
jgi:molybdenum cofactor cytidylyltransferase